MSNSPCMCGDTECPSCGAAQGTRDYSGLDEIPPPTVNHLHPTVNHLQRLTSSPDSLSGYESPTFHLVHRVVFHFKHRAVLHAIEQEFEHFDRRERSIIPNQQWDLEDSGEHGECWVTFGNDGDPFDPAELERCRVNIELIDSACEVMIRGTQAEKEHALKKTR